MPELPEVETVRRGLEKLISGKKIASLDIRYPKMIKTDLNQFQKEVPGQVVESMGRRGNYLLFYLTDKVLISHLRMEGKYFYYPDQVRIRTAFGIRTRRYRRRFAGRPLPAHQSINYLYLKDLKIKAFCCRIQR